MNHVLNVIETILVSPVLLYRYLRFGYTFRRIYLGHGKYTILDSRDYYRLRHYRWFAVAQGGNFYAHRFAIIKNTTSKQVSMHREIKNAPKNRIVDHHNIVTLDNRRANLRLATRSQNSCNRKKIKTKCSSRFVGVTIDKRNGRWIAHITYGGKTRHLGSFDSEIDAAKAYDKAARKYFRRFVRLNFPDPPDKWPGLEYYLAKLRSEAKTPTSFFLKGKVVGAVRSWLSLTIKKLSSS
ncbi:MAG: AP2 domain-containing protein [Sedimentisphaerales bacterium]